MSNHSKKQKQNPSTPAHNPNTARTPNTHIQNPNTRKQDPSTPGNLKKQGMSNAETIGIGTSLLHPTINADLEANILDAFASRPTPEKSNLNATSRSNIGLMSYILQTDRNAYLAKHDQFPTDINYKSYDRIEINTTQFRQLVDLAKDFNPPTAFELFEHPTIREFVCQVAEDDGNKTILCYKTTVVPNSILSLACLNSNEPCQAYIDAYVSSDYQTTDLVCCLGLATSSNYTVGTMCYESPDVKLVEKHANALIYNASRIYLAVQMLLRERPEIIVQRSKQALLPSPSSNKSKKTKKSKPHKVRYVKISYLDDEDLKTFRPKRHYTSPTGKFNVRGHWRHYKNGNTVWIDSYTKGETPNSNHPKQYIPKQYELPSNISPNSTK